VNMTPEKKPPKPLRTQAFTSISRVLALFA
jgi:hypothetical protein